MKNKMGIIPFQVNKVGIVSSLVFLCMALKGHAQENLYIDQPSQQKVTEVATQLAIGSADVVDTYLSPEKYRGTEFRFISNVQKDKPSRMTYVLNHEGAIGQTHNRAHNANELTGHYDFAFAAMYRWSLLDERLTLRAGGMTDLNLGFCYNTRNSANNPAQGYASLDIGAQASASYSFTLFKKPVRVNYEMRMPLLGIMFSPNYGQSYYEMFTQDDYDHNVVWRSLSVFQMRQQLSFDYPINKKGTCLRVGYLCDIRQAKPNNLKQHHWYNAATVGVVIKK